MEGNGLERDCRTGLKVKARNFRDKYKKSMIPVFTAVIIVSAIALAPVIYSLAYMVRFNSYKNRIQESFLYGGRNNSIVCEYEGNEYHIEKAKASDFHVLLLSCGMGKVIKKTPEEKEAVKLDFGDGSGFKLWPVETKDENGKIVDATVIKYEDGKGSYIYEEDGLDIETAMNILKPDR